MELKYYNQHANGQAESAVRLTKVAMKSSVTNHPRLWDQELPTIQMQLKNRRSRSTGLTPFYANLGREIRTWSDMIIPDEIKKLGSEPGSPHELAAT